MCDLDSMTKCTIIRFMHNIHTFIVCPINKILLLIVTVFWEYQLILIHHQIPLLPVDSHHWLY